MCTINKVNAIGEIQTYINTQTESMEVEGFLEGDQIALRAGKEREGVCPSIRAVHAKREGSFSFFCFPSLFYLSMSLIKRTHSFRTEIRQEKVWSVVVWVVVCGHWWHTGSW